MKSIRLVILILGIWFIIAGGVIPVFSFDTKNIKYNYRENAIDVLVEQIVNTIPDSVHLRLLGIGDIVGDDDNRIKEKLTQKLKKHTHFILIERHMLNQILNEIGIQMSDLIDDKTRIMPGKIQAVEGIIFGRILVDKFGILSHHISVHLNLDDVQSGEIIFSKTFNVTFITKSRSTVIRLFGVFLIIVYLLLVISKKRTKKMNKYAIKSDEVRGMLYKDIKQSCFNVRQSLVPAAQSSDEYISSMLVKVQKDLDRILIKFESMPVGPISSNTNVDIQFVKSIYIHDKSMLTAVKTIYQLSTSLVSSARNGNWKKVVNILTGFEIAISSLNEFLSKRPG